MNTTTHFYNATTTVPPTDTIPAYIGFITLAISIFFYGSFFVPVKQFKSGDGMTFQLFLCMGIWSVGYVVNWIRDFPKFYGLPMLGGLLWTTGNVTGVPIIKFIGLSLGILIWGTVSLVVGWANARFGWFGINAQVPKSPWMNYVGVALATVSGITYVFVKSVVPEANSNSIGVANNNVESNDAEAKATLTIESNEDSSSFLDRFNVNLKRILGVGMSIFSGILYALAYTPYIYVIDNYEGASSNALDYIYSFYSGIFISSIVYFVIYGAVRKNKPYVNINILIPGFISGCMWGIANTCFFIANTSLSLAITFPIGASGPPLVASAYGIFLYKEIKGVKNFVILGIGFVLTLIGAVFSGLSK